MGNKLSRRSFITLVSSFIAALVASCSKILNGTVTEVPSQVPSTPSGTREPDPTKAHDTQEQTAENTEVPTDAPEATNKPKAKADFGPRVIHAHSPSATSWNGGDYQYWNHVNQGVIDEMVDQGMMTLTGAASIADAWQAILPNYQPGQGIAIKVSFNNCFSCDNPGTAIDSVIEPVNAVIRGMVQTGVQEGDIWIYDASRALPDRFVKKCLFDNVQFFDNGCRKVAGWNGSDTDAVLEFNIPSGVEHPPAILLADVLVKSTYLINMPIMKRHDPEIGVSLSFKNHFGSINDPGALHQYIQSNQGSYRSDYSPLVDLYNNPHIGGKTVLTIGDGIFASKMYSDPPTFWSSFGGQLPNSLFFSTDPVALDCVMMDYLAAEAFLQSQADDYLKVAAAGGLGIFERGNPRTTGYTKIEYTSLDL